MFWSPGTAPQTSPALSVYESQGHASSIPDVYCVLAPVVRWEARQLSRIRPELEADLSQCGWLGALEAAAKFDPQRGVKLSTYARYRIRGAMLDFIGRMPPSTLELEDDIPMPASQESLEAAVFRTDVSTALSRLQPSQQFLVVEIVVKERPLRDVARRCGKSERNVQRELWSGLRILRVQLDAYAHAPDVRLRH